MFQVGTPASFDSLEATILNGQKLQGVMTSDEVQEILKMRGWEQDFPLFTTINRIAHHQLSPDFIIKYEEGAKMQLPSASSQAGETEVKKGPRVGVLKTLG